MEDIVSEYDWRIDVTGSDTDIAGSIGYNKYRQSIFEFYSTFLFLQNNI
jgi:hypothetical protein